ncbi:hypothetical protein OsI_30749 [Oryza sativa Indica Group]|uniref:Uncharacterized protein n=2 Tax=Oryza sativa TaxID=4530 RepID=B9G2M3_ORYSJ|nr:hypothetical protein OsI_30749 [Oryza sativa Indica Group]EEE69370.1 hypothetical protein OsJ_28717 [Oryza sativa Japonica Group]
MDGGGGGDGVDWRREVVTREGGEGDEEGLRRREAADIRGGGEADVDGGALAVEKAARKGEGDEDTSTNPNGQNKQAIGMEGNTGGRITVC